MPSFEKPEIAALDARVIGLSGYSLFKDIPYDKHSKGHKKHV